MALQKTVTTKLANGIVGEFYDDSVKKVDSYILDSLTKTNKVGLAYTVKSLEKAEVGGTGKFAGILVNPKQYVNYQITLGATDEVKDGIQASISKTGRIWVDLGATAAIGAKVYYINATGVLGVGTATTGQTQIPNCEVIYPADANGLAVIELFN